MSEQPIETIIRDEDGSIRTVVLRNGSKIEFRNIPISPYRSECVKPFALLRGGWADVIIPLDEPDEGRLINEVKERLGEEVAERLKQGIWGGNNGQTD